MSKKITKQTVPIDSISEAILALLKEHTPAMLKLNEISKALGITSDSKEYDALRVTLNDLDQNKLIFKSTRRRFGMRPLGEFSAFKGNVFKVEAGDCKENEHK